VGEALAQQAQLLTSSDLVWANLFHLPATQTLKSVGVKGVIAPPSQIVSNPEVVSANSFALVLGRLGSTTTGGKVTGLHGSELVSTEAVAGGSSKQLSPSAPTTVNVSSDLAFKVTFTDSGNFQEVKVPVTLTVSVFGKVVWTKQKVVDSIAARQTASVSFGNLGLPPSAFGQSARVKVEIGKVPGETHLENNSATYPVFFSLSSTG
jgi:hypothetical protein